MGRGWCLAGLECETVGRPHALASAFGLTSSQAVCSTPLAGQHKRAPVKAAGRGQLRRGTLELELEFDWMADNRLPVERARPAAIMKTAPGWRKFRRQCGGVGLPLAGFSGRNWPTVALFQCGEFGRKQLVARHLFAGRATDRPAAQ